MEPFDIIKMNIQELYNNAPDFESLKVKAQENAKQIVWTSGFYFQLEPYECERFGFKKGKILKKEPLNKKNKFCYLIDGYDRIVCEKEWVGTGDGYNYTFYKYHKTYIVSFHFNYNYNLVNAKIISIKDSRVIATKMQAQKGSREEIYIYNNDMLSEIDVIQKNGETEAKFRVVFDYDSQDTLNSIKNVHPNGYEEVRYKNKK